MMIEQLVLLQMVGVAKVDLVCLHLKRATCKSVQTHRCEKLSHTSDVSTFLCEDVGFSDVTLI